MVENMTGFPVPLNKDGEIVSNSEAFLDRNDISKKYSSIKTIFVKVGNLSGVTSYLEGITCYS